MSMTSLMQFHWRPFGQETQDRALPGEDLESSTNLIDHTSYSSSHSSGQTIIDIQDDPESDTTASTTIITKQPPSPPQPQSPPQEMTIQPQTIEPEPMQLDPPKLPE
jgi:hypothetical protein